MGIFGKSKAPAGPAQPVGLDEAKKALRLNPTQTLSDQSVYRMALEACDLGTEDTGYYLATLVNLGSTIACHVNGATVGTLRQRDMPSAVQVFTKYRGSKSVPCVITWTTRNWNVYVPMG